jgi:biotin operon repressor
MIQTSLKSQVQNYLTEHCTGRLRAVKACALAEQFHTTLREINEAVRQLRKDGFMIGSSKERPHGYYMPANAHEVREYLGTFRAELYDMLKTYNRQRRAERAYLDQLNQPKLFEEDGRGQMELAGLAHEIHD